MTPKDPATLLDQQRVKEAADFAANRRRLARAASAERSAAKLPPRVLMRAWPVTTKAGRRGRKARARIARALARMGLS